MTKMFKRVIKLKTESLNQRNVSLEKQYEALNVQFMYSVDAAMRVKLQGSMNAILEEIATNEDELARLKVDSTQTEPTDRLVVRVVVVAMNALQASNLDNGTVFAGTPDFQNYDDLRSALLAYGIMNLAQYYGPRPDDWSPLVGATGTTIEKLIESLATKLNTDYAGQPSWRRIEMQFISSGCLSNDSAEQIQSWEILEAQGGTIVVDAVSLHHPEVRQCLFNSQVMGSHSKISMIVLSPLKTDLFPANDLLRSRVYQAYLGRAFHYFENKLNPLFEFGVNDLCNLQRWLFRTLPEMKVDGLPPDLRQSAEVQGRSSGIQSVIIGGAPS